MRIYKESFPEEECMKVGKICSLISERYIRLHETKIGRRTVCFSIVECVSLRTLVLSYMAADPGVRSHGLGTRHMQRLLQMLKAKFPQAIALFFEIENRWNAVFQMSSGRSAGDAVPSTSASAREGCAVTICRRTSPTRTPSHFSSS